MTTTIEDLEAVLQPGKPEPKSEAQRAQEKLVTKLLAKLDAVNRTKAAMDGEVTDETPARYAAWRQAMEAWNLAPYELAAERKTIAAALKAEAAQQRSKETA